MNIINLFFYKKKVYFNTSIQHAVTLSR